MAQESNNHDFEEHERTYAGFLTFAKWGTIAMAALMVVLYFVINP